MQENPQEPGKLERFRALPAKTKVLFVVLALLPLAITALVWEHLLFAFEHWQLTLPLVGLLGMYVLKQAPRFGSAELESDIFERVCEHPSSYGELVDHFCEVEPTTLGPLLTRMVEEGRLSLQEKTYYPRSPS